MTKGKDTINCTNLSKSIITWDSAISDAETQIEEAKAKIKRLTQAVRTFKALRDKGDPFPGIAPNQSEAAK